VIVSNGFAAMGIGLPGAIVAQLAPAGAPGRDGHGRRRVPHDRAGAETGRRLGLAFVVLVMRDDRYGVISWKQPHGRRRPRQP
jgi:acetolactate synthase I/II/III large subunit